MKWMSVAALAAGALLTIRAGPAPVAVRSSTVAVTPDGRRLLVANADSHTLTVIDTATRVKVAEIAVCEQPATVATDGDRAYTVCGDGRIARIDLELLRVAAIAEAGVEPFGVVAHGGRLFVTDHGSAALRVLNAGTLTLAATVQTEESPRGLALDPASGTLYLTHFRSGRVTVLDAGTLALRTVIDTGADSNLSQSITLAGRRAYLPQTRSNVSNRALLFDNTVFPVVNVLDLETASLARRERLSLDVVDTPVNMPFDSVVTSSGRLWVVNAGSDDVSVIDLEFGERIAHIDVGSNPRGIALSPDERTVYVSNALSGTVSVIDTATQVVVDTILATRIPLAPSVLRGKVLFNASSSEKLSKDHWISCATCHADGGSDGRTWFFRDGLRNTPALFGVASTLPMHWSGDLDELQDVESTVRTVQAGTGLVSGEVHCSPACDEARRNAGRAQDLDDLAIFMTTLRAPRRMALTTTRGETLFSTHCAECHPAPLYTDRLRHDVGTGGEFERKGTAFDTPSLRGVFDTAPYLHDGSAATLEEAIARHAKAPDIGEIAAFVRGLAYPSPRRRAVR